LRCSIFVALWNILRGCRRDLWYFGSLGSVLNWQRRRIRHPIRIGLGWSLLVRRFSEKVGDHALDIEVGVEVPEA
jgi:hypothetical protein